MSSTSIPDTPSHSNPNPNSKLICTYSQSLPTLPISPLLTIPVAPGSTPTTTRAAQFNVGTLHAHNLLPDPFAQFHAWFSDPRLQGSVPETCTLSTAHLPSGRVSSRVVYLKELDSRGFVVYSNFGTSQKASDLSTNPHAALTFWHKPTERQIRIEGLATRLAPAESQIYYDTRARGSRIGAWASQQSSVLAPSPNIDPPDDGRAILDAQVTAVESRFADTDPIPVPPFWGGLRIVPDLIEFWQGRESRLHDRFRYTLLPAGEADTTSETTVPQTGKWKIERLSP